MSSFELQLFEYVFQIFLYKDLREFHKRAYETVNKNDLGFVLRGMFKRVSLFIPKGNLK